MANVTAIYELQNAVNINLTADSLFHELTKDNLLCSLEYSQNVYSLLNKNGLTIPFDEVSRVFNNSHNDHIEHTNKELFSCCQDMEQYLKTLPDLLSSEIEKPSFEDNTLPKTIDHIEFSVQQTKENMNNRLKKVCEKKQELFCDDGVYTLIAKARKTKESENINFRNVEKNLNQCSKNYLKQVTENYDDLFQKFSHNIDAVIKKTSAVKENTNETQMNRVSKFAEKKIHELSNNQEEVSPFQNENYYGTKNFINNNNFNLYYPTLLAQIESYRATTSSLEDRAMEVLSRFGHEQSDKLSQEQIVMISHNIMKMLKIDSHFIQAKTINNQTENFIICNPEEKNPLLFEPTKKTVVTTNGKEMEKPYKVTLEQNTIQKMKDGETITIGQELVTENKEHVYQEKMELGTKQKVLVKTNPDQKEA